MATFPILYTPPMGEFENVVEASETVAGGRFWGKMAILSLKKYVICYKLQATSYGV
jgi:hypothetical protein